MQVDNGGDSGLGCDFGLLTGSTVLVLGVELAELGGREVYGGFGYPSPSALCPD